MLTIDVRSFVKFRLTTIPQLSDFHRKPILHFSLRDPSLSEDRLLSLFSWKHGDQWRARTGTELRSLQETADVSQVSRFDMCQLPRQEGHK